MPSLTMERPPTSVMNVSEVSDLNRSRARNEKQSANAIVAHLQCALCEEATRAPGISGGGVAATGSAVWELRTTSTIVRPPQASGYPHDGGGVLVTRRPGR